MSEKLIPDRYLVPDRYLGDGVYASYDGYQIWLDTRASRDAHETGAIALEPAVLEALDQYRRDIVTARLKPRQPVERATYDPEGPL